VRADTGAGERDDDVALPRWRDPTWLAEVDGWVGEQLSRLGVRQDGAAAPGRAYPWSTVIEVPTSDGPVWFKANARGMHQEAALYEVLVRRAPGHVLRPLAVDAARGWLLLPDGGRTLRDVEGARTDLDAWQRMLVEYADLQRSMEPHVEEMYAAGLVDATPAALPAMRDALLADPSLLLLDTGVGLTSAERDALVAHAPAYAAQCRDLAAYGVPATLQHDDLHDHNVFAPATPGGPLRVFDWGDAVVGQPFGTLLVSLRFVASLLELAPAADELLRLRDAYLEVWTADFDRADLVEAARLAVRVGAVSRADCFRRAVLEWDRGYRTIFDEGVPSWLREQRGPTPLDPDPA
jgi:hypothetical protein